MTEDDKVELTPEMVEGPFYSKGGSRRSDIREGKSGQELLLTLTIVDADTDTGWTSGARRYIGRRRLVPIAGLSPAVAE